MLWIRRRIHALSIAALWLLSINLTAQAAAPAFDPDTLLLQVRQKMVLALAQLPRYMCTETIDRSVAREPGWKPADGCAEIERQRAKKQWRPKPSTFDRLRLNVAVSAKNEMYSWAGSDRFEDRSLAELVRSGATSTGAFSAILNAIFDSERASFRYQGQATVEGRALAEFAFEVPLQKSQYKVGDNSSHAVVPYHGTVFVDPVRSELVRLIVIPDHIPATVSACNISNTLNYRSLQLNGSDFVLPDEVRFHVIRSDGSEWANRTVFSGCHQFTGESSLRFDDLPEVKSGASPEAQGKAAAIPPHQTFVVALTEAIRLQTMAAGDLVTASLRKPIKSADHRVLVPVNAIVTGRIVQMQRIFGADFDSLILGIRLDSVEADGKTQPFHARVEALVKPQPVVDELTSAADPDVGLLRFDHVHDSYVIGRGTLLSGITLDPR